ncbi:uncharacterized protein LOC114252961 [Bombyx mandarina]|uniref:Uncharacterized protein LOC114252961 n=1 Tax=Bombyx mandarina TaxID=7092 RepID=A0A6J2KPJ8_BOMMA|nr:uncharacterized protein LOC114252961 [Bombyx mandarina]
MHYGFWAVAVLLLSENASGDRVKRTNAENFNALLNLYKINPLKKSKIFRTYADQILLSNKQDTQSGVLNIDSNESTRMKQAKTDLHMKEIDEYIHVTNFTKTAIANPDFDVQDVAAEKFNLNFDGNQIIEVKNEVKAKENSLDNILGHLNSGEINARPVAAFDVVTQTNDLSGLRNEKGSFKYEDIKAKDDLSNEVHSYPNSEVIVFR